MNENHLKKTIIRLENPALKAFFYQQAYELETFALPDSSVGIVLEKQMSLKEEVFLVTLFLTGGNTFVKSQAKEKDVFKAISKAKESLLKYLYTLQRQVLEDYEQSEELSFSPLYIH